MSEYQYYEFQAIDRPLDKAALDVLHSLSSRADISSTRLVSVYHYGNFKGNPDTLMDRYFDAHLYVANWGTRRLMLRLPIRYFPLEPILPFTLPSIFQARATPEHVVLDFNTEVEDFADDFEEGEGWLAPLISLRSDLLAGDFRCLYLSWLAGVQSGEVDESLTEPPVPPGLGALTGSLERFLDFLRIDPDLVEIAAATSEPAQPAGPSLQQLEAWIGEQASSAKDRWLVQLMQGEGHAVTGELLHQFRTDQARRQGQEGGAKEPRAAGRTAGALRDAWQHRAEERERQAVALAAQKEAQRVREQAEARDRHLASLAGREDVLWQQIETAIQKRLPKEYDHAVKILADLLVLAERDGTGPAFAERLQTLRERHRSKSSLLERFTRAGLP